MNLALATSGEFRHLDDDLPLLTRALEEAGVRTRVVDWHDVAFDWSSAELVVIRSTWDYTWQHEAFLAWCNRVARITRLANPVGIVEWNIDKTYLADLAATGVATVQTSFLHPGDAVDLPRDVEVVVKPAISAGGRDTERYGPAVHRDAIAHAERLLAEGRTVMIQPYLESIDTSGETSLTYFGDHFSHGFRKGPILTEDSSFVEGLYREESISPREPNDDEHSLAERALDALAVCVRDAGREDLAYARVDIASGPDGEPVLLELELIEPSFFCSHAPGSAERFAGMIGNWLQ